MPITFQFRERLRHAFGISAAYSTDLGGSGGITWGDRNVFGNAEQLNVSASLINAGGSSTTGLGYDTSVKYILPDFGHRDQSLQFAVGAVRQFLEAYDQTALTASVTLARKINRRWTVSVGMIGDGGDHQSIDRRLHDRALSARALHPAVVPAADSALRTHRTKRPVRPSTFSIPTITRCSRCP